MDKPVVFVAVNSGNPKAAVESWARGNKLEWPVLVDEFNETENSLGIRISLEDVLQWRLMSPEGSVGLLSSEPAAIRKSVDQLLPGAAMVFDGIAVPDKLKALAREIECGQYETAIAEIAAQSKKGTRGAAEMYEKLKPIAESRLEKAKAFEADGKRYAAYRIYADVAGWFRKTDYEKTAAAAMSELKKQKDVQNEIAAANLLTQAKKLLATGKKADRDAALAICASVQKKYPDTEAARDAERLKASVK